MLAVEKRFLTEKQLKQCLNMLEFAALGKTLQQVFLEKGFLTKNQIKRLTKEFEEDTLMEEREGDPGRKLFGELAIQQCMITEDQLFQALDVQDQYLERGLRVQIGQILYKKAYMTVAQVKRIVESQLKKVLYCTMCKMTKLIHSYDIGHIYQCEKCNLDLIEAKIQKPVPVKTWMMTTMRRRTMIWDLWIFWNSDFFRYRRASL
jgi:ribosomal protein L37AE/L43A